MFLLLFLLISQATTAESKLVALITLSRHGSRAPNEVVGVLCPPHSENMKLYNVPFKQLTALGMEEMEALGKHIREEYVFKKKLLSSSLSNSHTHGSHHAAVFETYFRADSAPRCAQSAQAMGVGLYPDGTGPEPFGRQLLAVVQQKVENEWMFCAPKNKCKATKLKDVAQYGDSRGKELMDAHSSVLDRLAETCGGVHVDEYPTLPGGEDSVLGLKDVVDAMMFDRQQGIEQIPGPLSHSDLLTLRQLQFSMLMERYYDTDRKVTYWASGFPSTLLKKIKTSLGTNASEVKYYSYHGHRELLYAMAMLLDWKFDFPGEPVALGQSAIPSATTLFFEIHTNHTDDWLEFFMWTPAGGKEEVKLKKCASSPCLVRDFAHIINTHIASTGTYEEICAPPVETETQLALTGSLVANAVMLGLLLYWGGGWCASSKRWTVTREGQVVHYEAVP